jgi:hypothetical protein
MAEEAQSSTRSKKTEVQNPVLTEIEQRASSRGWVPKDEWDGDPEEWRPAKEFIDRGELFKKIEDKIEQLKTFAHP